MTRQAVLTELLNRLQALPGRTLHISGSELSEWPADCVMALKSARLLVTARLASHLVCPGCERQCDKPVELYPAEESKPARAYIICDEPEDMGRIQIEPASLEQWRLSSEAAPDTVARALGISLSVLMDRKPSRQSVRDDAIRKKYEELIASGQRNYIKSIQRSVAGAGSLSDRRIRDIAKGR